MPKIIKDVTLYDVQEVATVVNKHVNTIYNWAEKGLIEVIKLKAGDSMWIDREELERICEREALPADMIEYRLGLKTPSSGKKLNSKAAQ